MNSQSDVDTKFQSPTAHDPRSDADRIEVMLDQWEEARGTGVERSPETLCSRWPHLIELVAQRIEAQKSACWMDGSTGFNRVEQAEPRHKSGMRIDGKYRLISQLGCGAFGEVWLAEDDALRQVAIKLPRRRGRSGAESSLENEARKASQLQHRNIVPILATGRHDGDFYIVSAFIQGETLAQRIRRGPLPWPDARRILIQIAEALAHARDLGIFHRDLKPTNILLDNSGIAYVGDFGIALSTWEASDAGGTGTADYMAPEQLHDGIKMLDGRCDLFSLGVILCEMLTGQLPLSGGAAWRSVRMDGAVPALPPSFARIPKTLGDALFRCLAPNPCDRFATADELLRHLGVARPQREVLKPAKSTPSLLLEGEAPLAADSIRAIAAFEMSRADVVRRHRANRWLGVRRFVAGAFVVFVICGAGVQAAGWMGSLTEKVNAALIPPPRPK